MHCNKTDGYWQQCPICCRYFLVMQYALAHRERTTVRATESAGRENDGPSKSQGVKMQEMKMHGLKLLDTKIDGMKQLLTRSEVTGC